MFTALVMFTRCRLLLRLPESSLLLPTLTLLLLLLMPLLLPLLMTSL